MRHAQCLNKNLQFIINVSADILMNKKYLKEYIRIQIKVCGALK